MKNYIKYLMDILFWFSLLSIVLGVIDWYKCENCTVKINLIYPSIIMSTALYNKREKLENEKLELKK